MSCHQCGFCQTDLTALENTSIDARSRGNYGVATLLNQALERCGVLRENLQPNDREYLKNVSRMAKEHSSSDNSTILLRDARRIVERTKGTESFEPTMRSMGFGSMFAASRGGSSTPTPKRTEPECHSNSGFIRMLDESKKGTDEIEQDESKHVIERVIESTIPRQAGFGTMLDASRRGTFEGDQPEPQTRIPDDRPHLVRRGMGFANMLEASGKGTYDQDDKPRARRGMGFGAMLEGAARGTE